MGSRGRRGSKALMGGGGGGGEGETGRETIRTGVNDRGSTGATGGGRGEAVINV